MQDCFARNRKNIKKIGWSIWSNLIVSTLTLKCTYGKDYRTIFRACVRNLDAVCAIEESSGPQNPRVQIVLRASKSAGVKGDVPKI